MGSVAWRIRSINRRNVGLSFMLVPLVVEKGRDWYQLACGVVCRLN